MNSHDSGDSPNEADPQRTDPDEAAPSTTTTDPPPVSPATKNDEDNPTSDNKE